MEKFRPGEVAPSSSDYKAFDRNGRNGGTLHLEKGEKFPATQHEGSYYVMAQSGHNGN